ncbi:mechanosensitive ion channel family protein [Shimia abyssi]|uniref:Small-conductance mechanosensitive channel n=1 Tax=Shimia abyssi TaxID=1662395 RepID=A0A2P8F8P9_9RHOB|nr:mechanosensitive ion channel family protein [Shimia abyssi]PSL18106.1 small-conductance mechanosensitive channel [Shimia abyssi]
MMGFLRIALTFVVLHACAMTAQAQFAPSSASSETVAVSDPSPNDVKEFLRLLGDPTIQNWITESANTDGSLDNGSVLTLREQIDTQIERISARAQSLILAWEVLPQMPAVLQDVWDTELSHAQKVRSVTYILIFLLIGFGLEWLYRQFLRRPLLRIEQAPKDAPSQKFVGALVRAAIIFTGLAIFAVGSIGAFDSFDWHPLLEGIVLDLLVSVLLFRILTTISLFFQAPRAPELRLVPYGTKAAKFLHRLICIMAFAIVLAFALSYTLNRIVEQHGMDIDTSLATVALAQTVTLALAVLLVIWSCIWVAFRRLPVLCDMAVAPRAILFWRNFLMILVGVVFALWLSGLFSAMWAVLVIGMMVPSLKLMRAWIDHFFDQSTAALNEAHMGEAQKALDDFAAAEGEGKLLEGEPQPDVPEFADPYVATRPIVQRAARFVFIISGVVVLSSAWGVNIFDLSSDRSLVGRILEILIDSIVALLLADLVWTWAKSVIDKRIADYEPPVDGQAPGPEARMITLLPLLRTILMVTLLIMVILSVLSAAGVNIAPILAGAGIVGIAIGFGTQSLVRDIVAGIFFLIDDAFRLGEYIEVGDLMGTVEGISVRSMRIRHHRGKVHTVPYGELKSLTNHSRDWVIMKLEFRVPFDTDLQLVKKLVKKVGAELQANEHYGPSILSTLKSQGVRRMEEFNMVVGVKFMTKPGEQWLVRRDAYQKVRDIFEANGIRMAERNVKVEIEGGEHLSEEQRSAVAGAAQEAAQGPVGPPKPIPDEP